MLINSYSLSPADMISVIERWNVGCTNFSEMLEVKAIQTSGCVDVHKRGPSCNRMCMWPKQWQHVSCNQVWFSPFWWWAVFPGDQNNVFRNQDRVFAKVLTITSPAELSYSRLFLRWSFLYMLFWKMKGSRKIVTTALQWDVILDKNLVEKRWVCFQKGAYRTVSWFPVCTLTQWLNTMAYQEHLWFSKGKLTWFMGIYKELDKWRYFSSCLVPTL